DRLGRSWWEETSPLNILHGSITPARFACFGDVLTRQRSAEVRGLRALDTGGGGGFLAEEFAPPGCPVTRLDPLPGSVGAARAHAAARGPDIGYGAGTGGQLPAPDSAFDLAYRCDVPEHVPGPDRVTSGTARALKPGGLDLFDTINRTRTSKPLA